VNHLAARADQIDSVYLPELPPRTNVLVWTRHSLYRIVVNLGTNVCLQGGELFPEPTFAQVDGASIGGSLLKPGWIGVGLVMEIRIDGKRLVTSPVRAIATEHPSQHWVERCS
jgi:hypothetical protein